MAIANTAHGGSATNTTVSATTLAITVGVLAGEFVLVAAVTVGAAASTGVTDNASGGSNTYYLIGTIVGASSQLSMFFCPSAKAATTVTIAHAASRASGSVSTYTGVNGVGQWKSATNAANNNTITLTNAVGAGNVMAASMGDATGTQTWTAVTGTLRNNIAGGGSTTPGATNMDTIVSGGSTCAASLSSSVSGEAIAIELLSANLPLATDEWTSNPIEAPQPPGSLGTLTLYGETEQFDWGWKPPTLQTYQEDAEYQNRPQTISFVPEIEDEWVQFGLSIPVLGGGGTGLMGFRGFWSLKAGMGSPEEWSFNPVAVAPAITAFDEDQFGLRYKYTVPEIEDELVQFGWNPPLLTCSEDDSPYDSQPQYNPIFDDVDAESEQFGFNPPVVTAISAFDQDEGILIASRTVDAVDDPVLDTVVVQDYDQSPIGSVFGISETDQDQISTEGFATDRVPEDYEQWVVGNQLSLYWSDDDASQSTFFSQEQFGEVQETPIPQQILFTIPELEDDILQWGFEDGVQDVRDESTTFENSWRLQSYIVPELSTDQDSAQSTFFAQEQYADQDEQAAFQSRVSFHEEDFGFNVPEVLGELLLEEEVQLLIQPYPVTQQVENEQVYPAAPFLTAFPSDDSPEHFVTAWRALDDDTNWGFNVPEIEGELLLEEEVQAANVPWVSIQQVEDEQFGQNAPFLQTIALGWEQDDLQKAPPFPVTYQVEFEQVGQNPPFLVPIGFDDSPEQIPNPYVVRDADDSWGLNTPELLGELLLDEELQVENQPWPEVWQTEDEQFGQNAPFLTAIGFDDSPEQVASAWKMTDDVETFGFNVPEIEGELLLEEEIQMASPPYPVIQQVDEDASQSTFFALEQYSDNDLQNLPKQISIVPEIEDEQVQWGYLISQSYAEVPEIPIAQQISFMVPELDSDFDTSQPAPTVLPNMLYDADFNPTMQMSYYFGSEDLEKYNWGWQPPMTKVTEDDSPYDSQPQLRSYFAPEIEDEQFSWGFDASRYYGLGDEAQYFTLYQTRLVVDDDTNWGFNTPVVVKVYAFDQDEIIPALKPLFQETDSDQIQAEGFATDRVPEDYEQWVVGNQLSLYWSDDDQTNLVLEAFADEQPPLASVGNVQELDNDIVNSTFFAQEQYADMDEQPIPYLRFRVDDVEQFSFNVPEILGELVLEEETQVPSPLQVIGQEDEPVQLKITVEIATDDSPEQVGSAWMQRDDPEQFGLQQVFPLDATFPDESIVQKLRIQSDEETFGQQPVFVVDPDQGPLEVLSVPADVEQVEVQSVFVDDVVQDLLLVGQIPQEEEKFGFTVPEIRLGWDSEENPPATQTFYWRDLEAVSPSFTPPRALFMLVWERMSVRLAVTAQHGVDQLVTFTTVEARPMTEVSGLGTLLAMAGQVEARALLSVAQVEATI